MTVIDRTPNIRRLCQQLRQFGRMAVGRVVGTTTSEDGRYKFHINAEERALFLRAELNAFVGLMITKGIVTPDEWGKAYEAELENAIRDQMKAWPEVTAVAADGMSITFDVEAVRERMKREGWPP